MSPRSVCLDGDLFLIWSFAISELVFAATLLLVASWLIGYSWKVRDQAAATIPFALRLSAVLGALGLAFFAKLGTLFWAWAYYPNVGFDYLALAVCGIWAYFAPRDMRRIVAAWHTAIQETYELDARATDLDRRVRTLESSHRRRI